MSDQELGFYERDSMGTVSFGGHDFDVVRRVVALGPDAETPLLTHTITHPFALDSGLNKLAFEARTLATRVALRVANFVIQPVVDRIE